MALESVISHNDFEQLEKIRDALKWFYLNYQHLKKEHSNKHVAIKDNRVIDCDQSLDALVSRLKIKDYTQSIAIEFVYND